MGLLNVRWFRIYLLSMVGVGLLAVGITLLVGQLRHPPLPSIPETPPGDLKFSDFLVEDPLLPNEPDWQLLRPPREKWEREEIMEFWVDPVELGIERLGGENDRMVAEFFETIP